MGEITTGPDPGRESLVQVAFATNASEAAMVRGLLESCDIPCVVQPAGIDGPSTGHGLLPRSARRVLVRQSVAEEARRALASAAVEAQPEDSGLASARNLRVARGRGPRSYGLPGAYARAWLVSLAVFAVLLGAFLLIRVL